MTVELIAGRHPLIVKNMIWLDEASTQSFAQALARQPLQLTFELIYGHAIKPQPTFAVSAQREISLSEMRAALARGKVTGSAG